MPTVRAANVAELVAVLNTAGKNFINRFHVAYGGVAPLSSAEANALAADFSNVYRTRVMGQLENTVFTVQFEANDIDPAGFASGLDTTVVGGLKTGGMAPINTAVMALWRAESPRYRGGKPRTYFGGIDMTDTTSGFELTSGALAAWQAIATGLRSDLNALTFGTGPRSVSMIYLETVRGKIHLPTPAQWPIIGVTVRQRLTSQRRRMSA